MNLDGLKEKLGSSDDVIWADIQLGERQGSIIYYSSLAVPEAVQRNIMQPLMLYASALGTSGALTVEQFRSRYMAGLQFAYIHTWEQLMKELLTGSAIINVEGEEEALAVSIGGYPVRSLEEPKTNNVLQGPKEGFVESMETNISLIRRRIRNPLLQFVPLQIGTVNQARAVLVYIEGTTDGAMVEAMTQRLNNLSLDYAMDTSQIMQFIQRQRGFHLVPYMLYIERTDAAASALLAGKLLIIMDGTPFVLVAPSNLSDFFIAQEDSYIFPPYAFLLKNMRYFAFFLAVLLPGIYIGLTNYNVEIIPISLAIAISGQRTDAPFPSVIELILLELLFELLRETTIRMPRLVGSTLTIAGAFVIGQAAVQAGLVTNIVMIIVALTMLATFALPYSDLINVARIVRLVFILLASFLGLFGLFLGFIALTVQLATHNILVPSKPKGASDS
ncbi:spore germination protein [Paenibacillus swuensis]|uniref:spore germination protein n=1 Tax=Paenibacillus swuensis TaxID=1178515 RepID=UPI00083908B2|nr:spore germination protein [Paenibacillus swuensis]